MPHTLPKKLLWIFAAVALIGFLDASFLTVEHYVGGELPCLDGGGCETVTTSVYSTIAGIPVALLGALYYLATMVATLLYIERKKPLFLRTASWFVRLGFVFSLWFVYLQLFVINAICLYCMGSAITTTVLFILSFFVMRHLRVGANTAQNLKQATLEV